jgi:NTP pyrophosphatase (non-canonical NTP hydrolase)
MTNPLLEGPNKVDLDYLPLLVEECGEVVQAAMKVVRFGPTSRHPDGQGFDNLSELISEVGDLLEVISQMNLPEIDLYHARLNKRNRLERYGPHTWSNGLERPK